MILLVGASASGKTEIAKYLAKSHGIKKAITHTTRKMREGERQDVDYHFVDEATFQRMLKEDKFVEHTCYNGNHYGCSKDEIADDKCVILDPEGLKSFLALNNQRSDNEARIVNSIGQKLYSQFDLDKPVVFCGDYDMGHNIEYQIED